MVLFDLRTGIRPEGKLSSMFALERAPKILGGTQQGPTTAERFPELVGGRFLGGLSTSPATKGVSSIGLGAGGLGALVIIGIILFFVLKK